MSKNPMLEKLAECKHPYYCSESNYYSNDPSMRFDTATDFLDEFEGTDVDMNLVFRWDVVRRDEGAGKDRYFAEVFIMHQRKGIFRPVIISTITEDECDRFCEYLQRHYNTLQAIWSPFSK